MSLLEERPLDETTVEDLQSEPQTDEQVPFRPRALVRSERIEILLAAAAGVTGSGVMCLLFDWTHVLTFAIWALLVFLVAIYLLARDSQSPIVATDRLITTLVWTSGGIAVAVLAWMLGYVVVKGIGGLN